ncbi:glycosyl hydrolase family 28-related protein [Paenibacillus sp. 1001270B_150601_E10]|uniref:glycosyl hydrolase family 28-related protein n=1 Tax=Paenibacillus sp. 1001270B_150601_E10 TaxID=2787079 RepID=UPI0018A05725|nr:glycosyl hydrolase family 28-related protein [Paenibacillus sp. 1001270B_150601_E10]
MKDQELSLPSGQANIIPQASPEPIWMKQISRRHLITALGVAGLGAVTGGLWSREPNDPKFNAATTDVATTAERKPEKTVKDYGAKGDGVSNDMPAILAAIKKEDTIYFPKGQYGIQGTLLLEGLKNKVFSFHPEARLVHLKTAKDRLLHLKECKNLTFYNLSVHSLSSRTTNTINVGRCDHLYFLGITKIGYSPSLSFVLRGASHTIVIETLIVDHPETRDGLSLMNCYNVTVGTVIGRGNSDDLVVIKAIKDEGEAGGSTHNIQIQHIHAYGSFGAFSIGSEIYDGDVYNVSVGQIVCHNVKRGLYFKMWDTNDEGITHTRRGEVYQIYIDSFVLNNDLPDSGGVPIEFDIRHDDYLYKYHDITIGSAWIRGAFRKDFVVIEKVERVHIKHLTTLSYVSSKEPRPEVNLRAVYIKEKARNCTIGGGYLEATLTPVLIESGAQRNIIEGVQPVVLDRKRKIQYDKTLVSIKKAPHNIIRYGWYDPAYKEGIRIEDSDNIQLDKLQMRHDTRTSPPTSGYWYAGERIEHRSPAPGQPVGWICTSEGEPGVWKGYGTIES